MENKQRVRLDYDNFSDYFPDDYPLSLVKDLVIGEDGIPQQSRVVGQFLTWLNERNAEDPEHDFVCSSFDAALILEHIAGIRTD